MLILIILLVFFILLSGALGWLLWINNRKYEKATSYLEAYVNFMGALYLKMRSTKERMDEVDRLGAFRADDEVGFIFTELKESMDALYGFITRYINTQEETGQKSEKSRK